jgi:xanthine dehydrogenase YagT iron-sulfur-binding subunit
VGSPNLSRRAFLSAAGSSAAAAAIVSCAPASPHAAERGTAGSVGNESTIKGAIPVTLRINGKEHRLRVDPRTTLLDCLRETVALTGTKKGCDHGQCGACTVHVNGRRVNSCLSLALVHDGHEVTTIEGLGTPAALHPMQAAFLACDA